MYFNRTPIPAKWLKKIFNIKKLTGKDKQYKELTQFFYYLLNVYGYETKGFQDVHSFMHDYDLFNDQIHTRFETLYTSYKQFENDIDKNRETFESACHCIIPKNV